VPTTPLTSSMIPYSVTKSQAYIGIGGNSSVTMPCG
jgi:hypothetical protein